MNAHSEAHPQQNSCAAINWTCPYTPSIYMWDLYSCTASLFVFYKWLYNPNTIILYVLVGTQN